MSLKIESAEVSPNILKTGATVTVKVKASMITWEDIRNNFATWGAVKARFSTWNDVKNYKF